MDDLLRQLAEAAAVYRRLTEAVDDVSGHIDRIGLFAYRINVMESDVMKSAVLALLDPERPALRTSLIESTLDLLESWLTRRMLVRATTKSHTQVAAEIVTVIRQAPSDSVDEKLRSCLISQTAEAKYWPDDVEVRSELTTMPAYRKLSRARLRMVLEAIEDHNRGYCAGGKPFAGMRVPRNIFWIEHIMPQSWESAWSPPTGTVEDRTQCVQKLGNLTLLTGKLNTSVSNGPWTGENGKRVALKKHDVLLLNRSLDQLAADEWTDTLIEQRTEKLIETIIDIWKVPDGYKASTVRNPPLPVASVNLTDLLSAGLISMGQKLVPQPPSLREHVAQVLSDGRLDVEGKVFETPSGAAFHLRKKATNGWSFWLMDVHTKRSLASIRREYLEAALPEANLVEDEDNR